ncbi:DUF5343 domain-containing protein [Sedimenticola selenatireducens]|uniref:DUF5343 domain-containing protein n=1 Tax=Sedimenticola selenatireducens TaxID=191960 RepID=UPI00048BF958|nr:DUF5343 domain-containing protein [Sedimenticola selenatireducens]
MSLPKSYLTSTKRLPEILEAIQSAQAPDQFTVRFLEQLGFKSKGDRLIIGVLKDLGFLEENGTPKKRYYEFLDQSHSGTVLAQGVREAWSDLFAVNINAHQLAKADFIGKLKTLSEGKLSDRVLDSHYMTFSALVKNADFTSHTPAPSKPKDEHKDAPHPPPAEPRKTVEIPSEVGSKIGGLVYNIQIVLPESRDPAVYDALFRSLKEHIL